MHSFAKIVAPAVAAIGLVAMAPIPAMAAAHDGPNAYHGHNDRYDSHGQRAHDRSVTIRSDIAQLNSRIDRAERRDAISRREAEGLRRESDRLKKLYREYARNGLSRSEASTLAKRMDRVELALRAERRDRDNRRG